MGRQQSHRSYSADWKLLELSGFGWAGIYKTLFSLGCLLLALSREVYLSKGYFASTQSLCRRGFSQQLDCKKQSPVTGVVDRLENQEGFSWPPLWNHAVSSYGSETSQGQPVPHGEGCRPCDCSVGVLLLCMCFLFLCAVDKIQTYWKARRTSSTFHSLIFQACHENV